MPTYSQNLPLIPTEYVPINYSHDAQFYLAEAQQAAENMAKVKSRYEDFLGWDLTSTKAKDGLSDFMKNAEQNIQKVSGMNMMVYDNAKEALDVFKPLTDVNGQYGYIIGDHAVTKLFSDVDSQIEKSKTENKGANYNPALENINSKLKLLYSTQNNPDDWKTFYYNIEKFKPGVDISKRLLELEKEYSSLIGEGYTKETKLGDGEIYLQQDKSIYGDKFQQYLETHLNEAEKEQLRLNKKSEYWDNVSTYAFTKDPLVRQGAYDKLRKSISDTYSNEKLQQIEETEDAIKNLNTRKVQTPASNTDMLKKIDDNIAAYNKRLESLKANAKLTDKELDALTDVKQWSTGQETYANFFVNDEMSKLANSVAMKRGKEEYKLDQNDWKQKEYNFNVLKWEQEKEMKAMELGLKYTNGKFEPMSTPVADTFTGTETLDTPEKVGKYMIQQDSDEIIKNSAGFDILDIAAGTDFSSSYNDEARKRYGSMTWNEAVQNKFVPGNNADLNQLVNSVLLEDGKGGKRKIDPSKDSVNTVLAYLKTYLSDKSHLDYQVKANENNPKLRNRIIDAQTKLSMNQSKVAALQEKIQTTVAKVAPTIIAPDGTKFSSELSKYKINTVSDLEKAIQDFSNKHSTTSKRIIYKEGSDLNNTGIDFLDVNKAMSSFFNTYQQQYDADQYLGTSQMYNRPSSDKKGPQVMFDNKVIGFAVNASEYKGLNKLIQDFASNVNSVYEGKRGFGVKFSSNVPESDAKAFIQQFNLYQGTDEGKQIFEEVDTEKPLEGYIDAINQINNFFDRKRISTKAINTEAKEYNIDANAKLVGTGNTLTSLNIGTNDLSLGYNLPSQKPVVVSIEGLRRGVNVASADVGLNLHLIKPIIKNGTIVRNTDGTVQLEHVEGDDLINSLTRKVAAERGISDVEAKRVVSQMFVTDATQYAEMYGRRGRAYLELIKFLNANKNYTATSQIDAETLNSYLKYINE